MSEAQEAIQRTEAELRSLSVVVEAKSNALEILKDCPAQNAVRCQALAGIFQVLGEEIKVHQGRGSQLAQQLQQMKANDEKVSDEKADLPAGKQKAVSSRKKG